PVRPRRRPGAQARRRCRQDSLPKRLVFPRHVRGAGGGGEDPIERARSKEDRSCCVTSRWSRTAAALASLKREEPATRPRRNAGVRQRPRCSIAIDGGLSPDSFRTDGMPATAESGRKQPSTAYMKGAPRSQCPALHWARRTTSKAPTARETWGV